MIQKVPQQKKEQPKGGDTGIECIFPNLFPSAPQMYKNGAAPEQRLGGSRVCLIKSDTKHTMGIITGPAAPHVFK